MSRISGVILASVVAVSLSACGSNPVKQQAAVDACMFPGSEKVAPVWVCRRPVEGMIIGVGSYPKSKAGYQFMTDMAAAAGRKEIASNVKIYVSAMVKNSLQNTGIGDTESVDAAADSTTKQITDGALAGSKIVNSITGPDGEMWVLVAMDQNAADQVAAKAVKTSMNNDRALWQKFLAQKSQDELATDIAKRKDEEKKQ